MQGVSWNRPVVFPFKKTVEVKSTEFEDYHNSHWKTVDSVNTGIIIYPDNTGDVVPLNIVLAGSSFWNRVGNKIRLKKLLFRSVLEGHGSRSPYVATELAGYGGVAIVYDIQPNGGTPSWRDVFEDRDLNGNSTLTADAKSSINWGNRERFIILYDSRQILPACLVGTVGTTTGVVSALRYPDTSAMDHCWWIEIDLTGPDGNAFFLLGTAGKLAQQLGLDKKVIREEMMAGNYDHLVNTFDKHFGNFVTLYK